jgi:hypothetical protein
MGTVVSQEHAASIFMIAVPRFHRRYGGVECFSETSELIYLSTRFRSPVCHITKLHFRKSLITSGVLIRVIVCSGYDREMTHMPFDICSSCPKRAYIAYILQQA